MTRDQFHKEINLLVLARAVTIMTECTNMCTEDSRVAAAEETHDIAMVIGEEVMRPSLTEFENSEDFLLDVICWGDENKQDAIDRFRQHQRAFIPDNRARAFLDEFYEEDAKNQSPNTTD